MVQSDALRHRGDVILAQAGRGAVLTRLGAIKASPDTGLVTLMSHGNSSPSGQGLQVRLSIVPPTKHEAYRGNPALVTG
jgi:hypothetical protein